MVRAIADSDYVTYIHGTVHQHRYAGWKARMLKEVDSILESFEELGVDDAMDKHDLAPRDIALLVRLQFLTEEEVERFDLRRIEEAVAL